jgi:hypothetical protein
MRCVVTTRSGSLLIWAERFGEVICGTRDDVLTGFKRYLEAKFQHRAKLI